MTQFFVGYLILVLMELLRPNKKLLSKQDIIRLIKFDLSDSFSV